jgi:ppGpp synthetase/RelA/SpoT-type nucleotidyltranferase
MTLDEYEKDGFLIYARLSEIVASILNAALDKHPDIRKQQCQHRAKGVESLRKKLVRDNNEETKNLEGAVKDLGGCRLIFYTNADVNRFNKSGILAECFEIDRDRTKFHQPDPREEDNGNLFISNNYVVRLKDDRAALYEYAEVAGLWCEVQIQTTLNHAWAEMEHDLIYKPPKLEGFGAQAMGGIERRMRSIMRRYLIPAGHEFAKVDYDFQRLSQGLEIFNRGALEELADAQDNNTRFELLEKFSNYVLSNYDDPIGVYSEVIGALADTVSAARLSPVVPISTEFGKLPGHEADDIERQASECIEYLQYLDVEKTFDTVCDLYLGAQTEISRGTWANLIESLAKHDLGVWKQAGPAVQDRLVRQVKGWLPDRRQSLRSVLVGFFRAVLSSEVTGTSSTHDTVTFHKGSVVASGMLKELRSEAIMQLREMFLNASNVADQRAVTHAFAEAMRQPYGSNYSDDLLLLIFADTARIIDFYTDVASIISHQLMQSLEHELFWQYRRAAQMPDDMSDSVRQAAGLVDDAIIRFRAAVNADPEFALYKLLVGFNSVFPKAWERGEMDIEADNVYRETEVAQLVDEVTQDNADTWFSRLQLFAATESDDLATFPVLGQFLRNLGSKNPDIAFEYLSRIDGALESFVPALLNGIAESSRADDGRALTARWIAEERHVEGVMRHFTSFKPPTTQVLNDGLRVAIAGERYAAVMDAIRAAAEHHAPGTDEFIDDILLPATAYLTEQRRYSWADNLAFAARDSKIIEDLSEGQLGSILKYLEKSPIISFREERLLHMLTASARTRLLDFFEGRLAHESDGDGERFEAIPHRFDRNLASSVPAEAAVERAFDWFLADKLHFPYRGARVVVNLFPKFSDELERALIVVATGNKPERFEFVLRLLRGYNGEAFLVPICKALVAEMPADEMLLGEVEAILFSTGVVMGELGLADAYVERKGQISEWPADQNEKVRTFARSAIGDLDRMIADERRRADASQQLRKLDDPDPDPESGA